MVVIAQRPGETLPEHTRTLFDRYHFFDLAFKVVGVGSVGTVCAVALFLAADDDPLFLQIGFPGPHPPYDPLPQALAAFGRFDLATSIGSRRGIEIQVLQERYAELGQLGIIGTERFDIVTHDLGSTTVKGPVAAVYGGT